MKATIEECHQQIASTGSTHMSIGLGLVAIAYAIRDVALALLREKSKS